MSALVESPPPLPGLLQPQLLSLPFRLDLTCPLALPSKPLAAGRDWPYQIAGPSRIPEEELDDYVARRYYEALFLPEVFAPLSGFTFDLLRITSATTSDPLVVTPHPLGALVKPLLLNLRQIEKRHRKTILPLLSAAASGNDTDQTGPGERERDVIRSALELRVGSKLALDQGAVPIPKKVSDELEKRETLIQIILLLLYMTFSSPTRPSKKRKRKHHRAGPEQPEIPSPTEDPKMALELLIDRLSVWQAVADLNLGFASISNQDDGKMKGKDKGKEEDGVAAILGRFWKSVMLPFFLTRQPEICTSFHQKVFGHPIPPKLIPVTTKKPRKPKLTRAIPSKDDMLLPPPLTAPASGLMVRPRSTSYGKDQESERDRRSISRVSSRAGSIAPSDNGSRLSPPSQAGLNRSTSSSTGLRRAISTSNELRAQPYPPAADSQNPNQSLFRRSRSRSQSIDPITRADSLSSIRGSGNSTGTGTGGAIKRPLVRNASSGKDLFKSREVGLLRRTASKRADPAGLGGSSFGREDSQGSLGNQSHGQNQSQTQRLGLLGRKTNSGSGRDSQRRYSGDDSQNQDPKTLIHATPSKPRQIAFFGPRSNSQSHSQAQAQPQSQFSSSFHNWSHPTPIREEPSSATRLGQSGSGNRNTRPTYIAETPVHPGRIARDTLPLGGWSEEAEVDNTGDEGEDGNGDGDGSDDPLGELWELTDDEDAGDEDDGQRTMMIPETPMKGR